MREAAASNFSRSRTMSTKTSKNVLIIIIKIKK
jgi:hypothetical protein